jgi:ferredoxin-NADP reductase/ferredoxin
MSYAITLTTQDGQQISFSCEPGQSVLEAAENGGFFLPALCNAGSCGSCLGKCASGDYHLGSYSPNLLPPNHQQTGDVLFCRTYPDSDLTLATFYTSAQIRSSRQSAREATISRVELIAERTMLLVLQLLPDEQQSLAFEFEPGQFVELEVPELALKRAYSIANTPNWDGKLEFLIRLQPHGQFSTYLQETAKVGQQMLVSGASGHFGLQTQSLNPRCFVAGGTGLAPFLSILRRMAEWGENHPTVLFLGVNNEREIFYPAELTALQQAISQLQVEICVWQASDAWTGFKGTPADALKAHLEKTDVLPDVFLCGPPLLVEAATAIALAAGVKQEQIFCESFA